MACLEIVSPVAEPLTSSDAAARVARASRPVGRPVSAESLRIGPSSNGTPQGDVGLAHTRAALERSRDDPTLVDVLGPDNFHAFVTGVDAGRSLSVHGGTISLTKEVGLP